MAALEIQSLEVQTSMCPRLPRHRSALSLIVYILDELSTQNLELDIPLHRSPSALDLVLHLSGAQS